MRIYVDILQNTSKKLNEKIGQIVYDGTKLTGSSVAARRLLVAPIYLPPNGPDITAKSNPELFIKNLHRAYSGSYFRCTKWKQIG